MHVVLRRGVVIVEDVRTDAVHQCRMQRIEFFGSREDARGRLARIRAERTNRSIHGVVAAAANRTADVVQDRAPGFVAHIRGNAVRFSSKDVRG